MKKIIYILSIIVIFQNNLFATGEGWWAIWCIIPPLYVIETAIPKYELYQNEEGKSINGIHFDLKFYRSSDFRESTLLNKEKSHNHRKNILFINHFYVNYTVLSGSKDIFRLYYSPTLGLNGVGNYLYLGVPVGYFKSFADKNSGLSYGVTVEFFPGFTEGYYGLTGTYERRYDKSEKEDSGYSISSGIKFYIF